MLDNVKSYPLYFVQKDLQQKEMLLIMRTFTSFIPNGHLYIRESNM